MKHIFTTCLVAFFLLHTIKSQAQPDPCENFAANFGFDSEFAGLNVQFVNSSTGDIGAVLWTFGDGTSADSFSPLHTYAEPGTYQICLHISNEWCSSETCKWVVIGEVPAVCAAHFNFETEGLTAWFNGNPSEANGDIIGWQWNFGDGTSSGPDVGATTNHTYAEAGTYTVCLTIWTADCEDDICQTVTVSGGVTPTCAAHFNFETEGLTAWFNGNPSEANGDIIGWQWNFGDGTSSGPDVGATTNHTYAEAGTYTVCLTIWTADCEDDICQTVVVEGPVSSNRLALPQNLTNSGMITAEIDVITGQTARVLVTNSSGQRVQVQTVDLLEGQNQVPLNLQPLLPGLYFVTLELANGKTITQRLCRIE